MPDRSGTNGNRWGKKGVECPLFVVAVLAGCGSGGGGGNDAWDEVDVTDDEVTAGPPGAPASDDPAFTVTSGGDWLMVGDGLTLEDESWEATVTAPAAVTTIQVWIEGEGPQSFSSETGTFEVAADVTGLDVGTYQVVLSEPGAEVGFAARTMRRSHALYVLMATDWDDPDNPDYMMNNMDVLRARHPELRYTHYVGPYTFTDETVTETREAFLVEWLTTRRDESGDEIGVHLHPYCSFVDTTSVTCRTEPSDVYAEGDPTGYTVIVASYTVEEMTTLLTETADLFEEKGVGRPTSFRAGGWTADEGTLQAVQAAGYVVDVNAIVADRIEEWDGMMNGVFYEWLMEHWGDITITTQPYWPSLTDVSMPSTPPDAFDVLEIPANAVIIDYVTGDELVEIFDANFPGREPLASPTIWHTGLHPPNFSALYMNTLDAALTQADLYLHSAGTGPVKYATATEMSLIDW